MPGPDPHVKWKVIDGERYYWYGDCGIGAERKTVPDSYRAGFDRVFCCEVCGERRSGHARPCAPLPAAGSVGA